MKPIYGIFCIIVVLTISTWFVFLYLFQNILQYLHNRSVLQFFVLFLLYIASFIISTAFVLVSIGKLITLAKTFVEKNQISE